MSSADVHKIRSSSSDAQEHIAGERVAQLVGLLKCPPAGSVSPNPAMQGTSGQH